MIRHYCDVCKVEITEKNRPSQGSRLTNVNKDGYLVRHSELAFEIITGIKRLGSMHVGKDSTTWNGGDFCKHCILDAVRGLDDRPQPAIPHSKYTEVLSECVEQYDMLVEFFRKNRDLGQEGDRSGKKPAEFAIELMQRPKYEHVSIPDNEAMSAFKDLVRAANKVVVPSDKTTVDAFKRELKRCNDFFQATDNPL